MNDLLKIVILMVMTTFMGILLRMGMMEVRDDSDTR